MTVFMHEYCVAGPLRMYDSMSKIIDKAAAHCAAKKIDPLVMTNFRLAPDMFPFRSQIFFLTELSMRLVAELTGYKKPEYPDVEQTFDELKERLARARAYLLAFTPEQLEGSENREVVRKAEGREFKFTGQQFAAQWMLPNVYFHSATAYNILRHLGVDIGKHDYLGAR
jgi:hypothetical protein